MTSARPAVDIALVKDNLTLSFRSVMQRAERATAVLKVSRARRCIQLEFNLTRIGGRPNVQTKTKSCGLCLLPLTLSQY